MTPSTGPVALLAGLLLLASGAAGSGLPEYGSGFPSGVAGQYGARLSARSYNVYNSQPAAPYDDHHADVAGSYTVGSDHNVGSDYYDSNSYDGDSSYNNVGTSHNNYDGAHSVYMRNNGHVADNAYTVDTPTSAVRAQSEHVVGQTGPNGYQDNYVGDYGGNRDGSRFQYRYEVSDPRTGDAKSKYETRDGDKVAGEYRVLEANGLMRVVSYTADDEHGFVAHVRWEPAEKPHGAAISHQEVSQEHSH